MSLCFILFFKFFALPYILWQNMKLTRAVASYHDMHPIHDSFLLMTLTAFNIRSILI